MTAAVNRSTIFCRISKALGQALPLALVGLTLAHAQNGMTDDDIQLAVEREILRDGLVPFDRIDIGTDDGIVSLSGKVRRLIARQRAQTIAESVKGVRAVVNRIVVDAVDKPAMELATDVEEALLYDSATDSYEVAVAADDAGRVTLTGNVQSWAEADLAGLVAMNVEGVTSVNNQINVRYRSERRDKEIEQDILGRLRSNVLVDDALIDVDVSDGVVRLTGIVGSAAERYQAKLSARVVGVRRIDADGLEVDAWAERSHLRGNKYQFRPDPEVETAVRAAIETDPRVDADRIDVSVKRGVVWLRGTVDSLRDRRAAENDAFATVGATSVENRVRVRPETERSAADIEQNIRQAFRRDAVVEASDIVVQVRNGEARLYGSVMTSAERQRAEELASGAAGVRRVVNNLAAEEGSAYAPDSYSYVWPPNEPGGPPYHPRRPGDITIKPDDRIERDIAWELRWSPFVDADNIDVFVEDGTATLVGRVDSWRERLAVIENAYEGGARDIEDRLVTTMESGGS